MTKMTSVYIGTYTSKTSEGIYHARFDQRSGELHSIKAVASMENPSYLAKHPSGKWLYAVSERQPEGEVTAFSIDAETGDLELLNTRKTMGGLPCYVSIDPAGRHVLVANYGGGNVVSFPIEADGRLGEPSSFHQHEGSSIHPERQQGPHAHCINPAPTGGNFVYSADLGLDRILIYRLTDAGLIPADPAHVDSPKGSGPRHLIFHPERPFLYVANELDSTVTQFDVDEQTGALTQQKSYPTLPAEYTGTSTVADIHLHAPTNTLYVSNRGHDSLAVFRVDQDSGDLKALGHTSTLGQTPRNFAINPTNDYVLVANQDSDQISTFKVTEDGTLLATGLHAIVSMPVCIVF